jgi:DNA-binding transcriptional regulator YdaS (Cro superfamily)
MQKLYCYVDETGQDVRSTFFLVSVVITEGEREELVKALERIEHDSGKGRRKWLEARDEQRSAYIRQVLANSLFKGKLHYAVYAPGPDYFTKTVLTVARAITGYVTTEEYRATVLIDGLPKSLVSQAGVALRRLRVKTFKVRGVRKEESDALMRLADAVCGFVRAAREGRAEFATLLERAKEGGVIREL